ncbi:MAG: cytochrome c biogenesis protein CcdA [Candidatus Moranbacteria bacterium]|nr:cytochrome c biogenesis protein CcdA [Candidatus Moranbacteria bacterium]MDD3965247.1 cytochrome c biogenesis protein CcdA [Candidatus Moranbacteria bacterium]
MEILFFSFLAGVLTILAPCVLPVLPVIIGGSVVDRDRLRPFIVTGSLALSIVLFTLLLKSSTALIAVPPEVWKGISGGIVLVFGFVTFFPQLWGKIETAFGFGNRSQNLLHDSHQHSGRWGGVLVGMALGPVFSSCSPTYALIVAIVLPQSFAVGIANLIAYAVGLSVVLLLVAFFGQRAIGKMKWASDPQGKFKKILGGILIFVGLAIIFGWDKEAESFLIEQGYFDVSQIETKFLR